MCKLQKKQFLQFLKIAMIPGMIKGNDTSFSINFDSPGSKLHVNIIALLKNATRLILKRLCMATIFCHVQNSISPYPT